MPQATDELRAKMNEYFHNDSVDDGPPCQYLEQQGFKLHRDWTWEAPDRITSGDQPIVEQEDDCINFLIDEWDFGGLRPWK